MITLDALCIFVASILLRNIPNSTIVLSLPTSIQSVVFLHMVIPTVIVDVFHILHLSITNIATPILDFIFLSLFGIFHLFISHYIIFFFSSASFFLIFFFVYFVRRPSSFNNFYHHFFCLFLFCCLVLYVQNKQKQTISFLSCCSQTKQHGTFTSFNSSHLYFESCHGRNCCRFINA